MGILLFFYIVIGIYCGIYALHCFQKKHLLPAVTASVLALLPFACCAVLFYLG